MDFLGWIRKFFKQFFAFTQSGNQDMARTSESIHRDLIPKIKALCKFSSGVQSRPPGTAKSVLSIPPPAIQLRPAFTRPSRIEIVAIGVSTGGPDALANLLPTIPARFPLPIVVAQHMPPIFTTLLAARLSSKCSLPVRECKSGEALEPGCIWIAPGDFHMVVQEEGGRIRLRTNQAPRENFCRPSVDVLFRSVASVYGACALGVILTGMGQDGLKGCQALCAAGSAVIVQDEPSSVVWGMPGFVARAGLAQKILPLDQIGGEIVHRAAAHSLAEVKN
jgi:two-component system, chemotaxis family, protein-glutamate methylesterase/glutaminase